MSRVLKNSVSSFAILASALAFSACAKNSDAPKAAAATAVTPELKADIKASECPEIIGTYQNASGDKVVYAMASVQDGVSYTVENETTIVDGKPQTLTTDTAGAVSYVATCKAGVMTRTTRNAAGEVVQTAAVSVSKETGNVEVEMTTKGVTEHFTMTRVSAIETKDTTIPEVKAEEMTPAVIDESVKSLDMSVTQGAAEEKSESPAAPAVTTDAVEGHAPRAETPYVRGFSRGPHFPVEEQY